MTRLGILNMLGFQYMFWMMYLMVIELSYSPVMQFIEEVCIAIGQPASAAI
jgi:hypothetical protein